MTCVFITDKKTHGGPGEQTLFLFLVHFLFGFSCCVLSSAGSVTTSLMVFMISAVHVGAA